MPSAFRDGLDAARHVPRSGDSRAEKSFFSPYTPLKKTI
jgi:hypothetical protein